MFIKKNYALIYCNKPFNWSNLMWLNPCISDLQLYHSETLELMLQRWSKLERDFRMKNGRYDISKIPDIYDCVKYDTQHNSSLGLENMLELFRLSRALADIIIPQVEHLWDLYLFWFLYVFPPPFFCLSYVFATSGVWDK